MTLDAVIRTVTESESQSWNKIASTHIESEGTAHPEHDAHVYIAVYQPDVSITMAWGLEVQHTFTEDWLWALAARTASREIVDIFYNGALVFRESYLVVDGARAFIPLIGARDRSVTRIQYALVKLIDELTDIESSEYVDYLSRIGVKIK